MSRSLKDKPGSLEDEVLKIRVQIDIFAEEVRVLEENAKESSNTNFR